MMLLRPLTDIRCADNLMVETTEWEYRSKQAAT